MAPLALPLRLALILTAVAVMVASAGEAAADHPGPAGASAEQGLRADERAALGPQHAAEHAAVRPAIARRGRLSPAARRRLARVQRGRARRFATASAAATGTPEEVGRWNADLPAGNPFEIKNFAIHAAMLPTGKVMYWGYPFHAQGALRPREGAAWLWDPAKGTGEAAFKSVTPPADPLNGGRPAQLFCSGESFLADGRLLLAGGNRRFESPTENWLGENFVFTFNPWSETWARQPNMERGRWYPSQVLLGDGRTAILGGYNETDGAHNPQLEVFTPSADIDGADGTITRHPSGDKLTGLYPHLFTMPDGKVLMAGPRSGDSDLLDPATFTWQTLPNTRYGHYNASAVLQPGGPAGSTRVMQIGGYLPQKAGTEDNDSMTDVDAIDLAAPSPSWGAASPLQVARSNHNTVLLPDGSMVTVGGGAGEINGRAYATYDDGRNRQVELYDPQTGQWRLGPAQQEDRAYHSTALLLPDGRVLSAGDDDPSEPTTTDTAEIYSPPYLFGGPRPSIASSPAAVRWGSRFGVGTANGDVSRAVLVAPSATTHGADMSQRHVELSVAHRAPGSGIDVVAPPNGNVAPPGYYMLFLLNDAGRPSVARWVRLGADAPQAPVFLPPAPSPQPPAPGPQPPIGPPPAGEQPPVPDPPAPHPPAPGDTLAPKLTVRLLSNGAGRIARDGAARLRIDLGEPGRVWAGIRLTARARSSRGRRAKRSSVQVLWQRAGRRTVGVRLTRAQRRLLRRGARLAVSVSAWDVAGNAAIPSARTYVLR